MWTVIWWEGGKFCEQGFDDVYEAHQLVDRLRNSGAKNIKLFKETFKR
jgi:hypothetical protein